MEDGSLPDQGSSALDVAVAVIERDGQILIAQRKPQDSFGGRWEFPGGKLNPGESLEACLAREIQEELGLVIQVGQLLKVVEHRYPHRLIRLHCFSCRVLEGEPRAIECTAWRWVAPSELNQYPFPPASDPLIEMLISSARGEPVEPGADRPSTGSGPTAGG